ncbi:MAG: FmdB family zinc ribbon protein, partial [Candidatus Rokuibacteriota bacterium]
ALSDSGGFGDLDENDPASVARFMKKMGKEFGDELGDDFDSAVDEAMAESDAGDAGGEGPDVAGASADPGSSDTDP